MICTRLHPGHLSVPVGDGSRRREEVVKILNCAPSSSSLVCLSYTAANSTIPPLPLHWCVCHTLLPNLQFLLFLLTGVFVIHCCQFYNSSSSSSLVCLSYSTARSTIPPLPLHWCVCHTLQPVPQLLLPPHWCVSQTLQPVLQLFLFTGVLVIHCCQSYNSSSSSSLVC